MKTPQKDIPLIETENELTFDEFKRLRDFMEATLTMDSLNSSDRIQIELRYFVQVKLYFFCKYKRNIIYMDF